MTKYQQIFYDIKHSRDYNTIGRNIDYKLFVDKQNKEVVLQFEESRQKSDWLLNFLFIPFPLKLDKKIVWTTLGYSLAYSSCKNEPIDLFEIICNQNPSYKWIIRGWSFGSAMTKIAVRHFYIRRGAYVLNDELTYGDVKVWLNPFIHWFSKGWVKNRHNFTCVNDLVSWCVPFYHRHQKNKVGGKFNLKKLLKTKYNHTHYEDYDYSEYEFSC